MAYGIDENGFTIKPLETIKTEIEDQIKSDIDPGVNTSASSVLGQIIGILSDRLSELWQVSAAVYSAFDPDSASGDALDQLSSLTATNRNPASSSTVTATVNLNAGITLPSGSKAAVSGNSSAIFVTLEDVTNSDVIPANVDVAMVSEATGAVVANAGTLTEIVTPVAGWNSITNALDAELGADIETDAALRIRRQQELRATGSGSLEAIKSDVAAVDNVDEVFIYENITLITDGDGIPGKAFEVLVLGGDDQDIADAIFSSKPAGIQSHGSETGTVTDSQGTDHTIKFTRPTEKTLMAVANVSVNEDTYPSDGDAQVKTSIATFADSVLGIGDDVIISQFYEPIFDVSGVEDVSSLKFYDNSSLGSERLSQTNFSSVTNWSETGDWDLTAGAYALYTHSTGTGSLTQTSANFAGALTGNRWYQLQYTISNVTGSTPTAVLTTDIALESTSLDMTTGTKTAYIFTKAVPGNFVVTVTSTSSSSFRFDDVSLKLIAEASGNYVIGSREIGLVDTSRIAVVSS